MAYLRICSKHPVSTPAPSLSTQVLNEIIASSKKQCDASTFNGMNLTSGNPFYNNKEFIYTPCQIASLCNRTAELGEQQIVLV